jgi:pilus assembly protein Flp/PilA
MIRSVIRLIKDEEAPTAVEYAIMVAGIGVAITAAVYALGSTVQNMFSTSSASIKK